MSTPKKVKNTSNNNRKNNFTVLDKSFKSEFLDNKFLLVIMVSFYSKQYDIRDPFAVIEKLKDKQVFLQCLSDYASYIKGDVIEDCNNTDSVEMIT